MVNLSDYLIHESDFQSSVFHETYQDSFQWEPVEPLPNRAEQLRQSLAQKYNAFEAQCGKLTDERFILAAKTIFYICGLQDRGCGVPESTTLLDYL